MLGTQNIEVCACMHVCVRVCETSKMVDSVSLSFQSLSLKSLSSAVRQTVDGPQGLAGGEDNIWKLIQFLPLCTALQSANTATG